MKNIFDKIKLNNLSAKNRLVRSATWEGIANLDGSISEDTYKIYDELARGGVGTIITGFTSVFSNDYYFDGMMRLSEDFLISQYKKLVEIIHAQDCAAISQIALGAFYRDKIQFEPDEMTIEEINLVREKFIQAAVRAEKVGFDDVQIHAAHFFFLSRFISPAVNHRKDKYGGSTEKRARLLIEILDGIKMAAPSLHVTIKINSSDFIFNGLNENESFLICKMLAEAGIDSIEVSGNGTSVAGIRPHENEGYFAAFASQLAEEINTPVILVGGLRSLDFMDKILNKTKIELISLSRPLLCEPDLPNKFQNGTASESKCVSCNRCYSSRSHKCIFRKD
ncbi:MAG: NADH:flavin oxidoreductase [Synergistaceae bacterium]|nr:NADH:flavin oxidoreductase [Synergistaceae bacterium]